MALDWIVVQSFDYGDTWLDFGQFYFGAIKAPHYIEESTYLYSLEKYGIIKSVDDGYTWFRSENGLEESIPVSLAVSPTGDLFAGTVLYWFSGGAYKFIGASDYPWIRVGVEMLSHRLWSIDYQDSCLIARTNYEVAISSDLAESWESIRPTGINCNFSEHYYGSYISHNDVIYVSNDECGVHYKPIDDLDWNWSHTGLPWDYIFGFGENQRGQIYASTWQLGPFISTDEGQSWVDFPDYLPSIRNIAFGGLDTLFAATSTGLYWSIDDGDAWDI